MYAEELMGHEGFTGTSSLLYHMHPPTTVQVGAAREGDEVRGGRRRDARHRHFLTSRMKKGGSPTLDRIPLLFNQDVAMLYVEPDVEDAHFYRNAQADELVYVSKGKGTLETRVRRPAVRRGRLPRHPSRHHAQVPLRRGRRAAEAAHHGEPRTHPPAEALSQRVRPAHRGRAVFGARHPHAARSS